MYVLPLLLIIFSGCATTGPKGKFTQANRLPDIVETPVQEPSESNISLKSKHAMLPKPPRKIPVIEHPENVIANANTKAQRNPDSNGYFNSSMVFDWEPDALYQIYTAPLRVTVVNLEQGEQLTAVVGGDDVRWIVNESTSGSGDSQRKLILIKPVRAEISTNIVITTDRRIYHLEVHSLTSENFMASVSWNYPRSPIIIESDVDEQESPHANKAPFDNNKLNFQYHFVARKKPKWMPLRVFDDGQKTFIQFAESMHSREAPGLFALGNRGDGEIINYRVKDSLYMVDKLVDIGELRLGDEVVGFERLN